MFVCHPSTVVLVIIRLLSSYNFDKGCEGKCLRYDRPANPLHCQMRQAISSKHHCIVKLHRGPTWNCITWYTWVTETTYLLHEEMDFRSGQRVYLVKITWQLVITCGKRAEKSANSTVAGTADQKSLQWDFPIDGCSMRHTNHCIMKELCGCVPTLVVQTNIRFRDHNKEKQK